MVLFAQSRHHDSQELLEDSLDFWGESCAHFGSDHNGQAVSQELWGKEEKK